MFICCSLVETLLEEEKQIQKDENVHENQYICQITPEWQINLMVRESETVTP